MEKFRMEVCELLRDCYTVEKLNKWYDDCVRKLETKVVKHEITLKDFENELKKLEKLYIAVTEVIRAFLRN